MKNSTDLLPPFLIMLDFDGTLVDIAPRPELIQVDRAVSALLESLQSAGHKVYIITGRRSDDVKTRLSPASIPVIGLHGLDWDGDITSERHPLFDRIAEQIAPLAKEFPGFYYENKEVIIGFHFRQVDDRLKERAKEQVRNLISKHLTGPANHGIYIIEGHEVIELKPNTVNKASAATKLKRKHAGFLPIYIGDDIPDEEAIAALGTSAVTIRVSPIEVITKATFRLDSPAQVIDFLRSLF